MNNKFVKYQDLLEIKEINNETDKEEFVCIHAENNIVFKQYQNKIEMTELEQQVPVRKTVYDKLIKVARDLQKKNTNYKLLVAFGYRELTTQKRLFNEILEEVKNRFNDEIEMYEYIHEKIAVPKVAGHPTGGAVDVAIYDCNIDKILNFGCDILDYSTNRCYYISNDISAEAIKNRKLLRKIMLAENFAPYDGEWWHFSYGDKEWAYYYNKKQALYSQVDRDRVGGK